MDYIKWQKKVNADYVLPGTLYLRGQTKPYFLNCIKKYNYDFISGCNVLKKIKIIILYSLTYVITCDNIKLKKYGGVKIEN